MSAVRASVLIPTHDHATTLPLTVGSVLNQTIAELEVLVIGDGVTAANRAAIEDLVRGDERVRFLDFPKGPHHGEIYRHEAVVAARSDAVFYLCDDDLVLPEHVSDLLLLLEDADLVQSRNGYFVPDGSVRLHPTDLAERRCVDWHLLEPRRNQTSITGTAHSRRFYLHSGEHWETTPRDEWPDHHQWKKFFRRPDFRGATSHRMTALQFPTHLDGRDSWTPAQRYDELARWAALVVEPGAQAVVDRMVDRATQKALALALVEQDILGAHHEETLAYAAERDAELRELRLRLAAAVQRVKRLRTRLRRRDEELSVLRAELQAVHASRSWRLTAPLRGMRGATRSRG